MFHCFDDFSVVGGPADQVEDVRLIHATFLQLLVHHVVQYELEVLA
jgi:hypothetical protein